MSSRNRQTSRRWFEEVWNDRSADAAGAMMTPEAVGHSEGGEMVGLDEFLAFRDRFLDAFPDLKFEVESAIADGDETAIRWVARGTHTGDSLGVPACHKPVEVRGMSWHRYEDGVMAEGWDSWNLGALMQHLMEGPEQADEIEDDSEGGASPSPARVHRPGDPPPRNVARRREIAERIIQIRIELFGEHGGPELARRLDLPVRTWYNYETGVAVPAEVIHDFCEITGAEPRWILSGEGPRYRDGLGPGRQS